MAHEKTNGTFIKTDHLLGLKASLNKFRRTGIMWILLSDYSTINGDLIDKKINLYILGLSQTVQYFKGHRRNHGES